MSDTKPAKLDFDGIGLPRYSEHTLDQICEMIAGIGEEIDRKGKK